jgi:hypothetical protein
MTRHGCVYFTRSFGTDFRVEKNQDGTLSIFEAFPLSGFCSFISRDEREAILKRFDVTGAIRRWLESN